MPHRLPLWFAGPLLLLLFSCGSPPVGVDPNPTPEDPPYEYRIPEQTGDGWETTSLADAGLREEPLVQMMTDLRGRRSHNIHSILLVRRGKLAFEEYFPGEKFRLANSIGETGFNRDDTHNLASVTKSITTTLFGIAADQGSIESVHTPVFDFFPEHADLLEEDPRRGEITLEHLMLMTSGLRWNDEIVPYSDPRNDMVRMFNSPDPLRFALSTPVYADPGTDFEYCSANTNILGEVVARAVGQRLDQFAAAHLFSALGIDAYEWQMISPNFVFASGDLRLRPRDMAKIGFLFLNGGLWNGSRVLSRGWITAATARAVVPDGAHAWADGYGYGWWHWDLPVGGATHRVYMASGWGEQWIVISPEDDLVFVTTGGSYFDPAPMPAVRLLMEYVIPSVQSVE